MRVLISRIASGARHLLGGSSLLNVVLSLLILYFLFPFILFLALQSFLPGLVMSVSQELHRYRPAIVNDPVMAVTVAGEFALGIAVIKVLTVRDWSSIVTDLSVKWSGVFLVSVDVAAPLILNTFATIAILGTPAPLLSANTTSLVVGEKVYLTAEAFSVPVGSTIEIRSPRHLTVGLQRCRRLGTRLTCRQSFTSTISGTFAFDATSYLTGNLVPDSSLTYALTTSNRSWTDFTFGGGKAAAVPFGSGNGKFSIADGQLTYLGDGSEGANGFIYSRRIAVIGGDTYSISASIDASYVRPMRPDQASLAYYPSVAVFNPNDFGQAYTEVTQFPGVKGPVSQTFTIPPGVNEVVAAYYLKKATVPLGKPVRFSGIDLRRVSSYNEVFNSVAVHWFLPTKADTGSK